MAPSSSRAALFVVFFLSGASALTYQVVWVRQLTTIVGATDYALATVLGTFMAGLAGGSLWASRIASRGGILRRYALLEAFIAGWALIVPLALRGARAGQGLLEVDTTLLPRLMVTLGGATMALLPATLAMGATLPLVSEWIAREPDRRGRDLGLLYGVNTIGAFVGVVVTGFWAIEAVGTWRATWVAAVANGIAALVAAVLSRNDARGDAPATSTRADETVRVFYVMAACAGLLGLAHEVVWNRLLGVVLISTTYAYTTMLASIIVGIGVGAALVAPFADRVDERRLFGVLQVFVGVSVLAIVPLLAWAVDATSILDPSSSFGDRQIQTILACALSILVPSMAMGATYPPLARAVSAREVGRSVGRLYAFNTAGAVVGSWLCGFVLLPWLGAMQSLGVLAIGNVLLGGWALGSHRKGLALGLVVGFAVVVPLALQSISLRDIYERRLPPGSRIVHLAESRTSTVMVADHSRPQVRRLWIQSVWVAGTGGTHRMLGHLPALHAHQHRRAAGIAFGTGQTFASVLTHGFDRLDCVDLDPGVVGAARFFAEHNGDLLSRDQVHVHIDDGRSFLARTRDEYDVIVMEPLQPWTAGTSALYTRELYEDARAALSDDGAMAQWLPLADVPSWVTRSVVGTFALVFDQTHVYLDQYDLIVVGAASGLDPARLEERLIGEVAEDLAPSGYPDAPSVMTALVLEPDDIAAYVGDSPTLTDDRPFLEFVAARTMGASSDHFGDNVRSLARAMGDARPASRWILRGIAALHDGQLEISHRAYDAAHRDAPCHRTRMLWRDALTRLAMQQPERALELYGRHLTRDPTFGGGWLNLGILHAQAGRVEAARTAFLRASEDPSVRDRAQQALRMLNP